jgi:hypothetical protein
MKPWFFAAALVAASGPVLADTATGSANCTVLAQTAADAVAARIQADDGLIKNPKSVKDLTCLDGFFNGFGLDLLVNILDPATLLANVETKICGLVSSTLSSLAGAAQCGLTISGFNLGGFGGIGGGNFCPKLNIGGNGPTWGTFGVGGVSSGGSGFVINGHGIPPTGYPLQSNSGSY